jgi:hypothetical protein
MKKATFIFIFALSFTLSVFAQNTLNRETAKQPTGGTMNITIGNREFAATLVQNSSTEALKKLLKTGPISIHMRDYGNMEKVGGLGKNLPKNDEQITTEPGDLILYQGNSFVIYYAPNTWSFTRLGRLNDVTPEELKKVLGEKDVTVTLEAMP